MSGTVARVTEISAARRQLRGRDHGRAEASHSDAANVSSAWIKEQKITLDDKGEISGYQVHMLITFVLLTRSDLAVAETRGAVA